MVPRMNTFFCLPWSFILWAILYCVGKMFICGAYCFVFDAGSNRDGDELLEPLCEDWLQIKGQLTSKKALLFFSLWLCAGNIFEMLIDCCTCFVSVRTVSYGLSFLSPESVTYSADRENQASKIYSISQGSNRGGDFNATVV